MSRALLVLALTLAVCGCGSKGDLTPRLGVAPPPIPYGREQALTTPALLTPSPQAQPERSVELRTRSEPREDDPFNLPPQEDPRP